MTRFRRLNIFFTLLFLISNVFSQSKPINDADWIQIKDDKFDFSISFPSNFLVDNEIEKKFIVAPVPAALPEVIDLSEKPRIIGNRKSVTMSLSVFQLKNSPNAKNYLWYFVGRNTPKDKYQEFGAENFVGRKTNFDTEKTLATSIAVAVKNKVFLINATAKNEDKLIYEKFVTSLNLNGKPLFQIRTPETSNASQTLFISGLQTSAEVIEALNRKQEDSETKIIRSNLVKQEENTDQQNFSRPLIILRKPYFKFVDVASKNNYSGHVKLKISFLSTGKIGDVLVVSDSPDDITKLAIKAAKKIKFLPAEVESKKIDSVKIIEYSFNES